MKRPHHPEIETARVAGVDVDYPFYARLRHVYSGRKIKVTFKCDKCPAIVSTTFKALNKRVMVEAALCPRCVMAVATSDPRWRKANSEAQSRVQGTPAAKLKNALGVSRFWKENPEKKAAMRERVIATSKTPETRAKYASRAGKEGFSVSGSYDSKWGAIPFDSSFEFAFLLAMEARGDVVEVARGPVVVYRDGEEVRQFVIDFSVTYANGRVAATEVKSSYISSKNDARADRKRVALLGSGLDFDWIDEAEALRLGFSAPRGDRTALFRRHASKIAFSNARHEAKYAARKE